MIEHNTPEKPAQNLEIRELADRFQDEWREAQVYSEVTEPINARVIPEGEKVPLIHNSGFSPENEPYADPGDYVFTNPNGNPQVISRKDFKDMYTSIGEDTYELKQPHLVKAIQNPTEDPINVRDRWGWVTEQTGDVDSMIVALYYDPESPNKVIDVGFTVVSAEDFKNKYSLNEEETRKREAALEAIDKSKSETDDNTTEHEATVEADKDEKALELAITILDLPESSQKQVLSYIEFLSQNTEN